MKFRSTRERTPRLGSQDALMRNEDAPQADFFDPRLDFPPSELARLKKLAGDMRERTILLHAPNDLRDSWWLSLVDPEYKELLLQDPEFADALLAKFADYFEAMASSPGASLPLVFGLASPAMQLFPELRQRLRQEYAEPNMARLSRKEHPTSENGLNLLSLVDLLQLYPEKRVDWMNIYSMVEDELVERLGAALRSQQDPKYALASMANLLGKALLVFPNLRSQILSLDWPRTECVQFFKTGSSQMRVVDKLELAFNLTIIGAEDARIDETGQIQLRLKPLPHATVPHSLPDRPLA